MKKLIILFIVPLLYCCTVLDDPIDTGSAESNVHQTMWEHLVNDTTWQRVTGAIEHAGIKYMFDGSDPDYQEVTFFGVTNQSIIRFLIENELKDVSDLAPEKCKMMLLSHMVSGKIMKDDCEFEIKGTNEGGTVVTSLTGKKYGYIELQHQEYMDPNPVRNIWQYMLLKAVSMQMLYQRIMNLKTELYIL